MKKIKYQHFTVECALDESVTKDNYWKYDIVIVWYKDDKFEDVAIIPKTILCMYDTEALLSGDEERAQSGLRNVIRNAEYSISKLKKLCM